MLLCISASTRQNKIIRKRRSLRLRQYPMYKKYAPTMPHLTNDYSLPTACVYQPLAAQQRSYSVNTYLKKPERPVIPFRRSVRSIHVVELIPLREKRPRCHKLVELTVLGLGAEGNPPPQRPPHYGSECKIQKVLHIQPCGNKRTMMGGESVRKRFSAVGWTFHQLLCTPYIRVHSVIDTHPLPRSVKTRPVVKSLSCGDREL